MVLKLSDWIMIKLKCAELKWYPFTLMYEDTNSSSIEKIFVNGKLEVTKNRPSGTKHNISGTDVTFYFSNP